MNSLIVLDLDGPILDGRYRHHACYAAILKELGYAPLPLRQYWAMKRAGINRTAILVESKAVSAYDIFLRTWLERIEDRQYLALDRIQPGSRRVLEDWRKVGYSLALVTARKNRRALEWQLNSLKLFALFEYVVNVRLAEDGQGKAVAFQKALNAMPRKAVVWVGDTEADVLAAKILDIPSVALTCGLRNRVFLHKQKPDFIYKNLEQFDKEYQWPKISQKKHGESSNYF